MRALLSYYQSPSPIGIWWVNSLNGLSCKYLPGHEPEEAMGRLCMTGKAPDASWDDFFNSLERRFPRGLGWESVELSRIAPQDYLTTTRGSRK